MVSSVAVQAREARGRSNGSRGDGEMVHRRGALAMSADAASAAMRPCVCVMAGKPYGTRYVGVTGQLVERAWRQREGIVAGFTKTYGVRRLVFYDEHGSMVEGEVRADASSGAAGHARG